MEVKYSDSIEKLLSDKWGTISHSALTKPVTWTNNKTKLNATNLNSLSKGITESRDVADTREGVLREAIEMIAEALANWSDNGLYDGSLKVVGDLEVSGALQNQAITDIEERLRDAEVEIKALAGQSVGDGTTIAERLSTVEIDTSEIGASLLEVKNYVNSKNSGGLQYVLADLRKDVDNIRADTDELPTTVSQINSELSTQITTLKNTTEIYLSALENRIVALENMIAIGTEDPENAGLDENTKYYIKYED